MIEIMQSIENVVTGAWLIKSFPNSFLIFHNWQIDIKCIQSFVCCWWKTIVKSEGYLVSISRSNNFQERQMFSVYKIQMTKDVCRHSNNISVWVYLEDKSIMRVEITLLVGALGIHYARGHGKKYLYHISSVLYSLPRSGPGNCCCHKDTSSRTPCFSL